MSGSGRMINSIGALLSGMGGADLKKTVLEPKEAQQKPQWGSGQDTSSSQPPAKEDEATGTAGPNVTNTNAVEEAGPSNGKKRDSYEDDGQEWNNKKPKRDSEVYGPSAVTDWSDLNEFNEDEQRSDEEWLKFKNESMVQKYGPHVSVKYDAEGKIAYYCEICIAEMNAEKSLQLHCDGMKHLKKVAMFEKVKKGTNDSQSQKEPGRPRSEAGDGYDDRHPGRQGRRDRDEKPHGRDERYGGGDRGQHYGGRGRDDHYGGRGRDDHYSGRGRDDHYSGRGRDDRYGGGDRGHHYSGRGRDDRYGGRGRDYYYGSDGRDPYSDGRDPYNGAGGRDWQQRRDGSDPWRNYDQGRPDWNGPRGGSSWDSQEDSRRDRPYDRYDRPYDHWEGQDSRRGYRDEYGARGPHRDHYREGSYNESNSRPPPPPVATDWSLAGAAAPTPPALPGRPSPPALSKRPSPPSVSGLSSVSSHQPSTAQTSPKADNAELIVVPLLEKLAECTIKHKNDADMALKFIRLFLKPLIEYSTKNLDLVSLNLLNTIQASVDSLKSEGLYGP